MKREALPAQEDQDEGRGGGGEARRGTMQTMIESVEQSWATYNSMSCVLSDE